MSDPMIIRIKKQLTAEEHTHAFVLKVAAETGLAHDLPVLAHELSRRLVGANDDITWSAAKISQLFQKYGTGGPGDVGVEPGVTSAPKSTPVSALPGTPVNNSFPAVAVSPVPLEPVGPVGRPFHHAHRVTINQAHFN